MQDLKFEAVNVDISASVEALDFTINVADVRPWPDTQETEEINEPN